MNLTLSTPRKLPLILVAVVAAGLVLFGLVGALAASQEDAAPAAEVAPQERQIQLQQANPLIDPLPANAAPAPAGGCLPGEAEQIVWPTLEQVEPSRAGAGQEVHVVGRGGYIKCGESGYNESSRTFTLLFDQQPVGEITCYVNRCEARVTIPADAAAGSHTIAVDGGSQLPIEVELGGPTRRGPSR